MNDDFFIIFDIIGIVAFSISGFIVALKNDLDLLGGFLICVITALGGGIMRDLLANNAPFAFYTLYPLIVVFVVFVLSVFLKHIDKIHKKKNLYLASDSVGLVFFSITGALVAISVDFHIIGVCFMSLITASGGGAIRDVVLCKIPSLFREDFYGMVAIIMGLIMFIEHKYFEINNTVIVLNMMLGLSIRYFVVVKKISVPKI